MKMFLVICMVAYAAAMPAGEEGQGFEGDIMLTPDQMSAMVEQNSKNGNQFAAMKSQHWKTNGKTDVIKYYIESSLSEETAAVDGIKAAVADYEKFTCIRFKRYFTKPSDAHLSFFKGGGCYSYVGRIRSTGQQISLGRGCWRKGTAMHEMGHALGFFHEQSRTDRDQYVEILTENIRSGFENNFNKYKADRIDSMGSPYDYRSMMHYGSAYFKNGANKITIRTRDPKYQSVIGQRDGFSEGDIEQFNKMYCSGVATQTPPRTQGTQPPKTTRPSTRRPVTIKSPSTGGCEDEISTCDQYTNYCSNSYFQKVCAKTCGSCGPVRTSAPVTRAPVTRAPVTRAPVTSAPGCKDKRTDDRCDSWKIICDTNTYVQRECRATCGLC